MQKEQITFALGMTAVAYLVLSANLTVASMDLKGFACGPTRMTGFGDCKHCNASDIVA